LETEESEKEGPDVAELLENERKRSQDLLSRLKYLQADLENYRKRADREVRDASDAAVRGLVLKLLVVLDELSLAVKHSGPERKGDLGEGLSMVIGNLEAALASVGVERIECVGKPFDPSIHEAAEKVEVGSGGTDIVVDELRPGYTFRGQVLRPSMVKVELGKGIRPEEEADE